MEDEKKLYDFYYSAEHSRVLKKSKMVKSCVNNREYTEMIESGEKPTTLYDDLKLIYTGYMEEVKFER